MGILEFYGGVLSGIASHAFEIVISGYFILIFLAVLAIVKPHTQGPDDTRQAGPGVVCNLPHASREETTVADTQPIPVQRPYVADIEIPQVSSQSVNGRCPVCAGRGGCTWCERGMEK